MLHAIQWLCQQATGSQCGTPRLSQWGLVDPSNYSAGVDLAEVGTAGIGTAIPINVKVMGGVFSTGLIKKAATGSMCVALKGYGGGGALSAGVNLPFVATHAVGRIPPGLKREIVSKLGGGAQGELQRFVANQMWGGISGGTQMITGPDCTGEPTVGDFDNSFATVVSLGANFGPNGVSVGLVMFAKTRPVLLHSDLVHVTVFGFMAGIGMATSIDVELSDQVFRCRVGA
jgi:hypothetical protein